MRTHAYVEYDAGALLCDVYPGEPGAGIVIYLHGGGFAVGDRATDASRVQSLAAHGLTVVVPDYRLVPHAVFPAQVDDVRAVIDWVRGHRADVGTDGRIGLWGASAGAVLATLTALGSDGDADIDVAAVVSWFGFSDIGAVAARSPLEASLLPPGPEQGFLSNATPERVRAASPINHVRADAPPHLIVHGDRDQIVAIDESRRFHEALTRAGAQSTLVTLGGAGHEDPRFDSPTMIAITAAFLRSHLA